jgi:hypothetical protein
MGTYVLSNTHHDGECAATFAAWRGFESPLRRSAPASGCRWSDHRLWWEVEAESAEEALRQLPPFVADRTEVIRVIRADLP